jgi:hypothetical protein
MKEHKNHLLFTIELYYKIVAVICKKLNVN